MDAFYRLAAVTNSGIFQVKRKAQEVLSGQGSVEWILIVALVAIALIAALTALANAMNVKLADITNVFTAAGHNGPAGA